jgi:VIT1/CCC1 family predicted Fe2+/Mn2+ transporter
MSRQETHLPGLAPREIGPHTDEPHDEGIGNRLNALRAAVLGANDGIVSVAGIVMGVAGATSVTHTIFVGGMAGLVAGALSMAAGEYVSVSTQRDTEQALLAKEAQELVDDPEDELAELAGIYRDKGLTQELALEVARQLTEHDALGAHAEAELGIDPDDLTNPWQAAGASMLSFIIGALLPLLTITLIPSGARIGATVGAVVLALVLTGWLSATAGEASRSRAILRNVTGGLLAMGVTYLIGSLVGTRVD